MQPNPKSKLSTGLLVASVIVGLWLGSLAFLCTNIVQFTPQWILPAILGRTFIQTGLFIVAHDAIHGSLIPSDRQLNNRIGQLSVTLYAFLSYQKLSLNHWQHHRNPGQVSDPDFHDGIHRNVFSWYLKFMQGYLDGRQKIVLLLGMGTVFHTLQFGFHVSVANLILFWVLPISLSSMQLFFFGTYLPHRSNVDSTKSGNAENSHRAISSNYPLFWSFLTCYHFGYHWEHHEYPSLPWYHLPAVRQPQLPRQPIKTDIGNPLVLRLATTSPLFTLLLIAC
ncbi:fatty acid desaturase [Leptolyngbya sp. FACHB-16]|uniref:fatty acid desaturase n=1 Tax=unclassified Leptolyngbya TaxID=2650499 RepID=UPI00321F8F0D